MAWPSVVAGDVLSGELVKETGKDMFNRDETAVTRGTTWWTGGAAYTGSLAVLVSKQVYIPKWMLTGSTIRLAVGATGDGVGNIDTRLDDSGGTTGTLDNRTTPTTQVNFDLDLTVPDDTWANTYRILQVKGQENAGAAANHVDVDGMGQLRFIPA